MAALDVNPDELVGVASDLAKLARGTGTAMPGGWVVPAGADPISAEAVPRLNAQAAGLFNGVIDVLNGIGNTARDIGSSAADYSKTDDEGARMVNGSGAELVNNPVGKFEQVSQRRLPPAVTTPTSGGAVDPLTFAQQLHSGPGPGAAIKFADSLRKFTSGTYTAATSGVDRAAAAMQNWQPVGTAAAANLTRYRGWLDQLGTGLEMLADGIDSYGHAFGAAKAKHPTPEEIRAARKKLISAMRSKNPLAVEEALAKFHEQNARSAETITGYSTEVNSKVPAEGGSGSGSGNGSRSGSSSGLGGSGSSSGSSSGSGGDMSMLASMLPSLMSAISSGMPLGQDSGESLDSLQDYGYDDYGIPSSLGSLSSGGPPIGGVGGTPVGADIKEVSGVTLPMLPTATGPTPGSMMPRTPVIDQLGASSSSGSASGRNGSPMMPYMPMAPGVGAGGGGGGDRNRVVAWHPDRLMYVDDTPHTEPVIGERPTIAPTVTPPTPSQANQSSTQSGGNV